MGNLEAVKWLERDYDELDSKSDRRMAWLEKAITGSVERVHLAPMLSIKDDVAELKSMLARADAVNELRELFDAE